jgi:hypothetical protein
MDRQPNPRNHQQDWRQKTRDPFDPFGKQSNERSVPFRHKPPLSEPQPGQ